MFYSWWSRELNSTLFSPFKTSSPIQYIRLGSDGRLRVYEWQETEWKEAVELMAYDLTECQYLLACGKYGICSAGQCSYPGASANGTIYIRPIDERQPNLGCSPIIPISCQSSQNHSLIELQNMDYFTFQGDIPSTDVDICKQTCLNNCSCKAALFRHDSYSSIGDCCLLSEVFSFQNVEAFERASSSSILFLKVENSPAEKNVAEGGNVVEKKQEIPVS